MSKHNLGRTAAELPNSWRSQILGTPAGANFKVVRMDAQSYPPETHPFDEALLVIDGVMNLEISGAIVPVTAGEVFLVPAGTPHAVAPGSQGTLVIIDR